MSEINTYKNGRGIMSQEKNHDCKCDNDNKHEEKHECGCGSHSNEDVEMMYLELDDGKELAFKVLAIFEVEDKEYIALLPEDGEEVYLYGFEENEEGPLLLQIETDEEYEMVSKALLRLCE